MKLEEYKDIVKLNELANHWIEQYEENDLGSHSPQLKRQYKEMKLLQAKTERFMDQYAGDGEVSGSETEQFHAIKALAEPSPAFAGCFGSTPLGQDQPVGPETVALAQKIKKLTTSWFGQFADTSSDQDSISLIASLHDRAKALLAAPKSQDEDTINMVFYGSKNKRCRRMKRNVEFVRDEYEGLVTIEEHEVEDKEQTMHKLGLENLPTVIFKRGKETIFTHEGLLSISALQQKVNVLLEGGNLSDSSSVQSIQDMKAVNQKELYNMGEYLLFYFTATWCGICRKTTPVIERYAREYNKVKFEHLEVDGSHKLHLSFGVTEVPAVVFVHDGKVIGKHTGYITPSSMKQLMEQFAVANKRKLGTHHSGEASVISDQEVNPSDRRIKDKHQEQQ